MDLSEPRFNIKSSWPRRAIWRHRIGSPLARVMFCGLIKKTHFTSHQQRPKTFIAGQFHQTYLRNQLLNLA